MEGIEGIFHVNIDCSNLERSLEFYKIVGFLSLAADIIGLTIGGRPTIVCKGSIPDAGNCDC